MKRWIFLGLGIIANLTQAVAYAGSVISQPLLEGVGVAEDQVRAYWGDLFSLSIVFLPLGMIAAGRLTDKKGPRFPIAVGALLYGGGVILSSFATSYSMLCVTLGFMLSFGSGLAYGPIVASSVRWFPDRRGLASGLAVGALGFGPVIAAPLFRWLLSQEFTVDTVLQIWGVITLFAMGAASFITSPPSDYQPPLAKAKKEKTTTGEASTLAESKKADYSWSEMIRTGTFWTLFALFILGTAPGLMVLSQASSIFQDLGGFQASTAALLVAILSAANALGRVVWGTISDYAGRIQTLAIMFLCSCVAMFALPSASNPAFLIIVILIIGSTFGGYLGLFPSFCSESFGLKNLSLNYALLFTAFSLAAIIGPRILKTAGSQQTAFYIAAVFAVLGCVGTFVYQKSCQKKQFSQEAGK